MTRFLPRHASCIVIVVLAGCVAPGEYVERGTQPGAQTEYHVPPGQVPPLGQCRIWYVELAPQWQPPAMACARAHTLAAKHGGRVVKAISRQKLTRPGAPAIIAEHPSLKFRLKPAGKPPLQTAH